MNKVSQAFSDAGGGGAILGNEPEWDLSAFYNGPDDPRIESDLRIYDAQTEAFTRKYKGRITSLSAPELLQCMKEADESTDLGSKISSYAHLLSAKNLQKYRIFQDSISKKLTDIDNKAIFFRLEVAQFKSEDLQEKIAQEPGLELYRVTLEKFVKRQPYLLGEEAETVASNMGITQGRWGAFFHELSTREKYEFDGKKLGQEEVIKLRGDVDRNIRQAATEALYKGLKETLWQRVFITNTLSQAASIDDDMRHMPNPVEGMNMYNNIDNEIVDAMNAAVNRSYSRIPHRYYEFMRQSLGLEKLKGWDRNAPLQTRGESKIGYDDAKRIVLDAYRSFSPRMADIAQKFFDNNWIDARVTPGKTPSAFSSSNSISTHPAVLLNYLGTPRDVATMAHELGHGVHQYLAAEHLKSEIASSTPLIVAETASVFGERITFERLLNAETDSEVRISLLAGKINDMINTVMRQNAFFNFEKEMHATRKSLGRDLESEEINGIYLKTQRDMLGAAFDLDEDYGLEWSYIPHFIDSPYYVYSYDFGECLVNSLYRKYQEADDKQEFANKYIALLQAGGTKSAEDLVKAFDLDLRDPSFWDGGMKAIEELMDRLEQEVAALKPQSKPGSGPTPA